MTSPAAKAKELFDKYDAMNFHDCADHEESAKECAIIAVNEVIAFMMQGVKVCNSPKCKFWAEVKESLQKL